MFEFLYFCLIIFVVGFAIYRLYIIFSLQGAHKKYNEAKNDLAVAIEEEFSGMLNKDNEDGLVYYDWGLEILKQYEEHGMFSYDEAIEKFRRAEELLNGKDKDDAEDLLCHALDMKYFEGDGSDKKLAEELDALYEKISQRDSSIGFLLNRADFKRKKGTEENNEVDLKKSLEFYALAMEKYPKVDGEEKKGFQIKDIQGAVINVLLELTTNCEKYEYLDELLEKLEQRKKEELSYNMSIEMNFAQYYTTRYVAFKDEDDLKKMNEICQHAIDLRSMDNNKAKIYVYWGRYYKYIAAQLSDDMFWKQAEEKYKEALDYDGSNIEAVKDLSDIYTHKGVKNNDEKLLTQAIELLVEVSRKLYFSEESDDAELLMESLMARFELLVEAVTIVRYSELMNRKSANRGALYEIGTEISLLFPTQRMGNILLAEGLLFNSVMDGIFEKHKKKILKNLQAENKESDFRLPEDGLDATVLYVYAAYYAQLEDQEDLVYDYIKKYVALGQYGAEERQNLLERLKDDPLFARFKHSSSLSNLLQG